MWAETTVHTRLRNVRGRQARGSGWRVSTDWRGCASRGRSSRLLVLRAWQPTPVSDCYHALTQLPCKRAQQTLRLISGTVGDVLLRACR
jgi:hypothetical protein